MAGCPLWLGLLDLPQDMLSSYLVDDTVPLVLSWRPDGPQLPGLFYLGQQLEPAE